MVVRVLWFASMKRVGPSEPSPEYEKALKLAVQQREAEERKLAAMTPEQRERYIDEWAERMAPQLVEDGCAIDRALAGKKK